MKERLLRVLGVVTLAVAAVALPALPASATTPPTISTYTDAVGLEDLILTGGTVLAGLIASVLVLVFAMLVVKSAVKWFRGT